MVRSIVSMAVAAVILVAGGFAENFYLNKTFDDLKEEFVELQTQLDAETCTIERVCAARDKWFKAKEKLHIIIPHAEIKEVDLWVAECVAFVKEKDYKEARTKTEVILQLFEQIPRTFSVRIENLL